jgi:capping protein (actin filament) muscle Z-line, beta
MAIRYYEGGVSSVFLWDQDDGGFAGVVLFKKSKFSFYTVYESGLMSYGAAINPDPNPSADSDAEDATGSWQSIHVFEASERGRSAHYKLTSTVMLEMVTKNGIVGDVNLSGSLTRQVHSFPL